MKKYIILLITLFMSCATFAQNNDNLKSVVTPVNDNNDQISYLISESKKKTEEFDAYKKKSEHLIDSLKKIIIANNKELDGYKKNLIQKQGDSEKEINNLKEIINQKSEKVLRLENEIDSVKNTKAKLSEKIFRQCLIYPLERSYSSTFIKEAKDALDEMNIEGNDKYSDYYEAYNPLLLQYKVYNDEIINLLNTDIRKRLNLIKWNNPKQLYDSGTFEQILNNSLYYKEYYKHKKDKPSISYLNERIDELKALFKESGNIDQQRFQNIIDKLQPKD